MIRHLTANRNRNGITLVMALVVMSILAIILTLVTLQIVSQHGVLEQRRRQLQAVWLTRAGVEIAAARLLENPTGFVDDKQELLPDAKIRIEAKQSEDIYVVIADVELGAKDEKTVAASTTRRFRRLAGNDAIRLQALPPEKAKEGEDTP